jgi:uncharacterized protein (TIGR03083 family)
MKGDLPAATAAERRHVADWLSSLDDAALATPSLCAGWDVRTVGAHLAVAVTVGLPSFVLTVLRYGGRPHRANDALARRMAQRPVSEIIDTLRTNAGRRLSNPGTGPYGPLTDVLVHTGDMRRPLGVPHDPPRELVVAVLAFLTSGRAVGFVTRGRLRGLRLIADDADFAWGTGEDVRGRAADLMIAVCGRAAGLTDLHGPGAEVLRARL